MDTSTSDFLELQSAVAGRYSLEREIGRGGMGIVYLARDVLLERPVAIKLLAPSLARSAAMRHRFLREARIAAQCFHPHIVPIHSVEEAGERAFIVMSYVQGETLAERLRRAGPLAPAAVARIGREIGWALAYTHERGVIHRDVKPENILLEDASDRALITDFGIALRDDPMATPASGGEVAGTARFMAPEQALGEPVDGRADLYALGVTLYLAATGRFPHDGSSAVAVLAQQTHGAAPSVRALAPALPPMVADAIDRCLSRQPAERFPHATAFVAAMEPPVDATRTVRALWPVQERAASARSLLGGALVAVATTRLLVLGEGSGIGASIIEVVGGLGALLLLSLAATRTVQALLEGRKALRLSAGVTRNEPAELVRALAGQRPTTEGSSARRVRGAATVFSGALLALFQPYLYRLADSAPGALGGAFMFAIFISTPLLIGLGAQAALRGSRITGWLHDRVGVPLARRMASWIGAAQVDGHERPVLSANAATEVRLDFAARDLFARLPSGARELAREMPEAAAALARHAGVLRAQDRALVAEERAIGASTRVDREAALEAVAMAREKVRATLGTTIAALETIRIDLLRLEAGELSASGITTHLEVVRDVERRIDANAEVRALLRSWPSGQTPT